MFFSILLHFLWWCKECTMCVQKCPLSHGDLRLFGFDIIDKVTNDWQTPRRRQFAFTWQHWGWWWWLSKKEYICIVGGAEKFRENWDRSAGFLLLPQKSSFPFIVFSWAKSSFDQVIRPASLISSARNLGWGFSYLPSYHYPVTIKW